MIDTNVNSLLEEFFVHLDPTWDVGYLWAMSHGEAVKLRLWIHDQKKREVIEKPTNGPFVNFSFKKSQLSHNQVIYTFHVNLAKLIILNYEQISWTNPKHIKNLNFTYPHIQHAPHITPHPNPTLTCSLPSSRLASLSIHRANSMRQLSKECGWALPGIRFVKGVSPATPLKTNMSPENQWLEDVFPTKIVPFLGTC